ncbi:hypothetical protein SAMN05444972_10613 [Marininema halotolerans]|uniref:Uncharacterized protein n=1 Tax=Marininema halotolerans TaxID=1155944 RepID=A0A1I6RXN4_9BACL|nr:hypothetical protein SAMN05444972_10613 [Marininema halotolerans]
MWIARLAQVFTRLGGIGRLRALWTWWRPLRSMHRLWKQVRPMMGFFSRAFG